VQSTQLGIHRERTDRVAYHASAWTPSTDMGAQVPIPPCPLAKRVPTCWSAGNPARKDHGTVVMASLADKNGDSDMVALTVRVPRALRQRLRIFAAQRDVSVQQCTAEAVYAWLENYSKEKTLPS